MSPSQWFAGWNADEWAAFGSMLLALGAVITGFWALVTYRRSKRVEAARWVQDMFKEFYFSPQFRQLKQAFQYDFEPRLAPLLERRLTNRNIATSELDRRLLEDVDILLNYFEQLLYLEDNGHVKRQDRVLFFRYWFDLLSSDPYSSLRRYISVWDWERLAKELKAPRHEYVAVYGSLMSGLGLADVPDLHGALTRQSECTIRGELFDVGKGYPALVAGSGSVKGELYRATHELPDQTAQEVFEKLDAYERYDAQNLGASLYIRRVVRLLSPPVDAWVYFYHQDLADAVRIDSGDWRQYVEGGST